MAWTAEQKEHGKKRLTWLRATQTPGTYRKSFFLAVGGGAVGLIISRIGFAAMRYGAGWGDRAIGMMLLCLAGVGVAFCSALAYVRYLDWRRAASQRPDGRLRQDQKWM